MDFISTIYHENNALIPEFNLMMHHPPKIKEDFFPDFFRFFLIFSTPRSSQKDQIFPKIPKTGQLLRQ
jgi:hypothetical protein